MSQTQTQRDRENSYALAGNIESVAMTNFMCHANLEIKLCPGVNFVVGENGSGKSAILTALCVALVRALGPWRTRARRRLAARRAPRARRSSAAPDPSRRRQGARASKTNRSETGNKGLVKTGANIAKVVVRMRNQGPEAYRAEDFGHTIIVERTISATVRAPAARRPPVSRLFDGALVRRARASPRPRAAAGRCLGAWG